MSSETPVVPTDSHKYGEQLNFDPEFQGPVKHRSCTDIICLFLFVSFLAGWLMVAYFAFREGDPKVLVYPTDSVGNICGIGDLEDKPYLFFFDLMKCASPSVIFTGCLTPKVCVEKCPNETFYASSKLPDSSDVKSKLICEYDVEKKKKSVKDLVGEGHCATLYLKSFPFLGRCIPELFFKNSSHKNVKDDKNKTLKDGNHDPLTVAAVQNSTSYLAHFLSIGEMGQKVFSDFKTSWKFLIAGLVFSMVLSLVWIVMMRWIAMPMVWLSIILVLGLSAYGCYYSTMQYIALKDVEGSEEAFSITLDFKSYLAKRKTWLAFAISCGLLCAILFLVVLFLRSRIRIAIALIKQASRAVASMPTSLFFPLLPYLMMLAFLAFWAAVALYIASSGKASFVFADVPAGSSVKNGTTCNPKKYNATGDGIKCLFQTYGLKNSLFSSQAYNLFGLFWGLFFSVGVGQIALAGAFASYYWTRNKSKDIPKLAVASGLYRCLRFHLGSVAFGSLLIATVRMIRVVLEYVDKKLKKYDNAFTKAVLCCCKCFFWLLENILKFISKNAYIMVAIYGKNFCSSAKRAFFLLMRNIVRVVVVDKLTEFLLFFGKLVVVAFTAGISFYLFSEQTFYKGMPPLNYNLLPPILISVGSYLIASAFFSVYGMAVDTLFLCFLEDCERNDGSAERPYFMSKELMKILHKSNKFRELSPPQAN